MKRILLVKLPHPKGSADFLMPPLGLLYIAAAVLKTGVGEPEIADLTIADSPEDTFKEMLRKKNPDVVGITAFTRDFEQVCMYCELIRKTCSAHIVIGGPISATSARPLLSCADFVVCGEGEVSAVELLKALSFNNDFSKVPNLIYKKDGKFIENKEVFISDIDEIPEPAWHLINLEHYFSRHSFIRYRKKRNYAPLFSSRGCPFKCAYCHKLFGKKFRPHSAERVVADIMNLYKLGVREFQVIDDSFNLDKKRVMKIFELLKEKGIRDIAFAFPNGLEPSTLDEEMLGAMSDGGVYYISFAVEAGAQRIRNLIHKTQKLSDVFNAMKIASCHRIFCHGFFMVGFPGEFSEEIDKTLSLVCNPWLHTAEVFNVMIYPETELASLVHIPPEFDYDYDYFSSEISFSEHISAAEILDKKSKTFLKFYLNPRRVYRILRDLPVYENRLIAILRLFLLFFCKVTGRLYYFKGHG